jgi:hypothetical protein
LPIWISNALFTAVVESILKLFKNLCATETSASSGHGRNQSILHCENSEGNFYALSLNFVPTGENAKIICKQSLTLLMK